MIWYDLHLHSCLSPCGDTDMTVNNIIGMAQLKGLQLIALTDHNTCANTPALQKAAQGTGLCCLYGMELTTSEEIHAVCLFDTPQEAQCFSGYVYERLPGILNDEAIFGEQLILDETDTVIGHEKKLLINATEISIFDLDSLMERFGGIYFPAHVDKSSNSVFSALGVYPQELCTPLCEFAHLENWEKLREQFPQGRETALLSSSDAHYLWDIREGQAVPDSPRAMRVLLEKFPRLRGALEEFL